MSVQYKFLSFFGFFLFCLNATKAQFYYQDFVLNIQTSKELMLLKEKKKTAVKITSFEPDGTLSEGFYCKKEISKNYTKMETVSQTSSSYKTILTTYFNDKGKVIRSVDSSEVYASTSYFTYDAKGNLVTVLNNTRYFEEEYANETIEERKYSYNEKNQIIELVVTNNKKASVKFVFTSDEKGNLGIEKNTKTGEIYYYYYDVENRLTDIVHKYANRKNFSTDFIFTYNDENQMSQMQSAEQEGAYYFTWKYTYEELLRKTERCFSKEGRLLGSVEYEYR